jgi:hypothetical protein
MRAYAVYYMQLCSNAEMVITIKVGLFKFIDIDICGGWKRSSFQSCYMQYSPNS